MKKIQLTVLAILLSTPLCFAQNQWIDLSKSLNELDIQTVAADPRNSKVIFAGSDRHLYKTEDEGVSWKRVLGLRGHENKLRSIYPDPFEKNTFYACSDSGLQKSVDSGKRWSQAFRSSVHSAGTVYCVDRNAMDREHLWIGAERGLFRLDSKTLAVQKISSLPALAVYSILWVGGEKPVIFLATNRGIYRSKDFAGHWERVFGELRPEAEKTEGGGLEQFDIEEFSTEPLFSNMIFMAGQDKILTATKNGVLEGSRGGTVWSWRNGQNIPTSKINLLAKSAGTFYAATDKGIFQWDDSVKSFKNLDEGLNSQEIKTLFYNSNGDYLLTGTERGVFKLSYPELTISVPISHEMGNPMPQDVLGQFSEEPSIAEIQKAAIEYAEVHPRKIEAWRTAAMRKALLPTVSFGSDYSKDRNVDVDRGGTNDPDRFIMGPEEKSFDWSVDLSWDLGEIIWNDDQTSIDTRSRLMVELRDDILNEVTHLYFERRRLQAEMALSSRPDMAVAIERQIKLEELTANIDALTGSYLSTKLKQNTKTA